MENKKYPKVRAIHGITYLNLCYCHYYTENVECFFFPSKSGKKLEYACTGCMFFRGKVALFIYLFSLIWFILLVFNMQTSLLSLSSLLQCCKMANTLLSGKWGKTQSSIFSAALPSFINASKRSFFQHHFKRRAGCFRGSVIFARDSCPSYSHPFALPHCYTFFPLTSSVVTPGLFKCHLAL